MTAECCESFAGTDVRGETIPNSRSCRAKGYSRLRKHQLTELLFPASLIDEPVPDIKALILQPSAFAKAKNVVYRAAQKVKSEWTKWTKWLLDHIPEKPKVDEALQSFKHKIKQLSNQKDTFELKEVMSAFKQFITEYTIRGIAGYDAESLLRDGKPLVVNLLEKILMIKVKMGLQCMTEKTNIKTGKLSSLNPLSGLKSRLI